MPTMMKWTKRRAGRECHMPRAVAERAWHATSQGVSLVSKKNGRLEVGKLSLGQSHAHKTREEKGKSGKKKEKKARNMGSEGHELGI